VSLSFGLEPHSSASVLVWAGSVMELSASESLENNESCAEVSVSIDPQLEWRSMAKGRFVRELDG
jgi:hypothetical protein